MSYETLELRREGAVAWLTLNRPGSLNALNPKLVRELRDFFGRLPEQHDVRVVVLSGAGRAFCAGLDLKEPVAEPGEEGSLGADAEGVVFVAGGAADEVDQ